MNKTWAVAKNCNLVHMWQPVLCRSILLMVMEMV
jgi:hypothetical protein